MNEKFIRDKLLEPNRISGTGIHLLTDIAGRYGQSHSHVEKREDWQQRLSILQPATSQTVKRGGKMMKEKDPDPLGIYPNKPIPYFLMEIV